MLFRALFSLQNESQSHSQVDYPLKPLRNASNTLTDAQQADSPPVRRRKLRKVKPDYRQLRYEPPAVETFPSLRPESILSTHSRTPLLRPSRVASSTYAPRRVPNKLEKRDKMQRMSSVAASSSFGFMEVGNQELSRSSTTDEDNSAEQSPSNIETEDLVSFAWTGQVQTENSPLSSNHQTSKNSCVAQPRSRSRTKFNNSMRQRSSMLQKPKATSAHETTSPRPWSLAMILSDNKITDEKLVDQLEDMRLKELPQRRRCLSASCPSLTFHAVLTDSYAEYPPEPDEFVANGVLDSSWNTARHALLLCREMLRTESRYLSSLKILAKGGTATFPPLIMFHLLPGLIVASEEFVQLMTKNPSVRGVSEAFLSVKERLDEAFVSWCSVAGSFFADGGGNTRSDPEDSIASLRRIPSTPIPDPRTPTTDNVIILEPNKIRRNGKKRPSVRELAILPTQRIVRYVLLFKELSALTPPSFSASFVVAQALHAAQLIGKNSDEAQVHTAFIAPST